jgi:hypothetical protein
VAGGISFGGPGVLHNTFSTLNAYNFISYIDDADPVANFSTDGRLNEASDDLYHYGAIRTLDKSNILGVANLKAINNLYSLYKTTPDFLKEPIFRQILTQFGLGITNHFLSQYANELGLNFPGYGGNSIASVEGVGNEALLAESDSTSSKWFSSSGVILSDPEELAFDATNGVASYAAGADAALFSAEQRDGFVEQTTATPNLEEFGFYDETGRAVSLERHPS